MIAQQNLEVLNVKTLAVRIAKMIFVKLGRRMASVHSPATGHELGHFWRAWPLGTEAAQPILAHVVAAEAGYQEVQDW